MASSLSSTYRNPGLPSRRTMVVSSSITVSPSYRSHARGVGRQVQDQASCRSRPCTWPTMPGGKERQHSPGRECLSLVHLRTTREVPSSR